MDSKHNIFNSDCLDNLSKYKTDLLNIIITYRPAIVKNNKKTITKNKECFTYMVDDLRHNLKNNRLCVFFYKKDDDVFFISSLEKTSLYKDNDVLGHHDISEEWKVCFICFKNLTFSQKSSSEEASLGIYKFHYSFLKAIVDEYIIEESCPFDLCIHEKYNACFSVLIKNEFICYENFLLYMVLGKPQIINRDIK